MTDSYSTKVEKNIFINMYGINGMPLLPFSLSYMRQKKRKKRLRLINGKCSPGTETETAREADRDRQANRIEEK